MPDKQDDLIKDLIKAFDKAGLWEDGIELIGSWCFRMYQKHMGVPFRDLQTRDVDFLIPRPYLSKKVVDIEPYLKEIGFEKQFNKDGSIFFQHPDLKLEFLTPELGRGDEKPLHIRQLGISPVSIRFLKMLFDDPIKIKEGGVSINIPNPRDYCLHKLIIAQRRRNLDKREKDISHAVHVLSILKTDDTIKTAAGYPKKWRALIKKSLSWARVNLPEEIPTIDKYLPNI